LEERFLEDAFFLLVAHPFFAAAEREELVDLRELVDFFVLLLLDFLEEVLLDFFEPPLDFLEPLLDFFELLLFFLPFAPPVSLFTVAQPMRSASFSLPPRFLTLSSMCSAIRFCLPL
jgi:hypothetical protein